MEIPHFLWIRKDTLSHTTKNGRGHEKQIRKVPNGHRVQVTVDIAVADLLPSLPANSKRK